MDLDNEELNVTKNKDVLEAIEGFINSLEFETDAKKAKWTMTAIKCMQNYIDEEEGEHIPRID